MFVAIFRDTLHKMKNLLCISLLFSFSTSLGQTPFREAIETDSSNIEIIRNSVYRVYSETFKKKDLVWYNVTYIDDTTQLNTEGWKLKNGRQLGVWNEYDRQGNLLFTQDYDNHICVVNPKMFPNHTMLEKMKQIADKMIVEVYGKQFKDKHIVFNFDCYAYNKYKTKSVISDDSLWTEDYIGSWTEPMTSKPNSFLLRYEVRLNPSDEHFIELGICLDSNGKYVPSEDDMTNNYGFELVKTQNKDFTIDKEKAIELARKVGLKETDSKKIEEFLFWENFKKQKYFNGQFRYYITELVEQEEYNQSKNRRAFVNRYIVYVFNPWTGEFVEKKRMQSRREWEDGHGLSTGLIPDKE
jgi:hypothetical protein